MESTDTNPITEPDDERRRFVLQVVQPGLAGLMDGSVSTLAPLFAAAFATGESGPTFKVGLAAALGAGISMAFAEAMSDDGRMSGRGSPTVRGLVCGGATTVGGLGHTLPYLIDGFELATASISPFVSFIPSLRSTFVASVCQLASFCATECAGT